MQPLDPHATLRKAKNIDHHIIFPLRESSAYPAATDQPDDSSLLHAQVHPTVVTWYKLLTNRPIQRLQLYKTRRGDAGYFITLELDDHSILKFHRTSESQTSKSGSDNHLLATVTNVSDPTELATNTLWMSIDMICDKSSSTSSAVDLRFILAVFHGIYGSSIPPPAENKLFALALTICVARRCLRVETQVVGKTQTRLDDIWQGAHSFAPGVGESLWEDHIAEETRKKVHRLVFSSSRDQVMKRIAVFNKLQAGPESGQRNENEGEAVEGYASTTSPDASDRLKPNLNRTNAASIVAWIECSTQKRQAAKLATWDEAWDDAWKENWDTAWESEWGKLGGFVALVGTASADGRASGRAAGRASINGLTAPQIAEPAPVPTPATSIPQEDAIKETGTTEATAPNWLSKWRSCRYPSFEQKWAPVWQTASDMAWAQTWAIAEDAGRKTTVQILGSPNISERPNSPLSRGREPAAEPKAATLGVEQSASKSSPPTGHIRGRFGRVVNTVIETIRLNKSKKITTAQGQSSNQYEHKVEVEKKAKLAISKNCPPMPPRLVEELVETAWKDATLVPGSAEADLGTCAQHAQQSTPRLSRVLPRVLQRQDKSEHIIWEEAFQSTWQAVWRTSWKTAWEAVWQDSAKDAWEKGIQEGINVALDERFPTNWAASLSEEGQRGYEQFNDSLNDETSYSDTLWNIRSSFKALALLHDAFHHSVPTYYKGVMKITIYNNKHIYNPKPEMFGENDKWVDAPHHKFQGEIKQHLKLDSQVIQMNKIWAIAIDIYRDPSFLPSGKESSEVQASLPTTNSVLFFPKFPGAYPD
ncbi:hypothetical protein BDV93DRAFT_565819 [Ceratobasidium sp. AG-I]|nr:hypothetical protein BDV93DRAFT_565819 [Ceratobasidium sp. AG-I]